MDKKIERSFHLTTLQVGAKTSSGVTSLFMYSRIEGEYGVLTCTCCAELDGDFISARTEDQAEPDGGFDFRLHELGYFIQCIVPLFKPISHGQVSFSPPQES